METLIHADIFFFITAIAVVVVGTVLGVAGVYGILILRSVRRIARRAEHESALWQGEFAVLREGLKSRTERVATLFDALAGVLHMKNNAAKGRRRKKGNA